MQTVLQKERKILLCGIKLVITISNSWHSVQTQAEERKTTLGERNHTTWEQLSRGDGEANSAA